MAGKEHSATVVDNWEELCEPAAEHLQDGVQVAVEDVQSEASGSEGGDGDNVGNAVAAAAGVGADDADGHDDNDDEEDEEDDNDDEDNSVGPFESLLGLMQELRATNLDLLHDMGGSEEFIIDGESLVYEVASLSTSRKGRIVCPAAAIYQVELLLNQLRAVGGSFTITFCSEYADAWAAHSAHAYAVRQCLIAHLHTAFPGMVQQFECVVSGSEQDISLVQHIKEQRPAFVLVSDLFVSEYLADRADFAAPHQQLLPSMVVALIFNVLASGADCAYVSGLSFDSVTVHGWMTAHDVGRSSWYEKAQQSNGHVRQLRQALQQQGQLRPLILHNGVDMPSLHHTVQHTESVRLAVAIHACAGMLSSCALNRVDEQLWLCDAWLLHAVLLRALPLQQRALLPTPIQQAMDADNQQVCCIQEYVHGCLINSGVQLQLLHREAAVSGKCADELPDCFDSQLFTRLLALLYVEDHQLSSIPGTSSSGKHTALYLALPSAVAHEWHTCRLALRSMMNVAEPIIGSNFIEYMPVTVMEAAVNKFGPAPTLIDRWAQLQPRNVLQDAELPPGRLEAFNDTFVGRVLKHCVGNDAAHHHAMENSAPGTAPLFANPQPYQELYHWHTRERLEDAYWTQSNDNGERYRKLVKEVENGTISTEQLLELREISGINKKNIRTKLNQLKHARASEQQAAAKELEDACIKAAKDVPAEQAQKYSRALQRRADSIEGPVFKSSHSIHSNSELAANVSNSVRRARENRAAEQRKAHLEEEAQLFHTHVLERISNKAWYENASDLHAKALAPMDELLLKDLQPEIRQVVLATKLLALYKTVWHRLRNVQPGAELQLGSDVVEIVKQLFLTIQKLQDMGHASLRSADIASAGPDTVEFLVKLPWSPKRTTSALAAIYYVLQAFGWSEVAATMMCAGVGARVPKHQQGGDELLPAMSCQLDAVPAMQHICPVRFQLHHLGPYLARTKPQKPDGRVEGFVPDNWQTEVLDIIDAGGSAVVSAPTSSGKTFISAYVVKSVLRYNQSKPKNAPKKHVVIVAPTKALVIQTEAQMHRSFPGKHGVFTRDHRQHVLDSEVLLAVPACLETLLLSPANRKWVDSLAYIILDEVHCMNERDSGDVWERLMQSARCPILALSATIGNPLPFVDWLQRIKHMQLTQATGTNPGNLRTLNTRPYQVDLVMHNQRYNDLCHHMYIPSALAANDAADVLLQPVHQITTGAQHARRVQAAGLGSIEHMHPIFAQDLGRVHSDARIAQQLLDLSMSPAETMQLCDRMTSTLARIEANQADAANTDVLHSLKSALALLDPATHFKGSIIGWDDAKAWCKAIMKQVHNWCCAGTFWSESMCSVQYELCAGFQTGMVDYERHGNHSVASQLRDLYPMLLNLSQRAWLPAIVFNFSKSNSVKFAGHLLKVLKQAEEAHKSRYSQQLMSKKASFLQARQAAADTEDDTEQLSSHICVIDGITFSLDDNQPSPSFCFGDPKASRQKLNEEIEVLRVRLRQCWDNDVILAALQRGIGVHHAGLPKHYRQAVETLFRMRVLQVVIATGTLAYGIHMPCRCVIMAGDSMHLDALQFRQMSGRAGRRGLDVEGQVLMFHVPVHKTLRLLKAPLPRLRGQFLLTPTFVLRAALLSQSLRAEGARGICTSAAVDTTASMVQESFLQVTAGMQTLLAMAGNGLQDPIKQQMLHSFCMAVRHLRDNNLLNEQGEACGLAGLVTHTFWTEPSNFVLARLLGCGALAQLCTDESLSTQERLQQLLVVTAHLFERISVNPTHMLALRQQARGRSSSVVKLPKMPVACRQAIKQYNRQVIRTATQCAVAYARAIKQAAGADTAGLQRADATLPLSHVTHHAPLTDEVCVAAALQADGLANTSLCSLLLSESSPLRVHSDAASPWMCLGGLGDKYTNVHELVSYTKPCLRMTAKAIPVADAGDRHGRVWPLNAYILDSFKNADISAIVKCNGVRDEEAFEHLKKFRGVLAAIANALEDAATEDNTTAARAISRDFADLSKEFTEQYNNQFD